MSLLQLPDELLVHIGQYLEWDPLYQLSRTNHHLNNIANEQLYTHGSSVAMFWAARYGDVSTIKLAMSYGEDIDCTRASMTPLLVAADHDNMPVVRYLLDHGASIIHENNLGMNALHYVAKSGSIEVAEVLVDAEIEIERSDAAGMTALMYAVAGRNLEMIEFLLDVGADIDASTVHGDTAFSMATSHEELSILKMLHARGARTDTLDSLFMSPLVLAVTKRSEEIVIWMFAVGAGGDVSPPPPRCDPLQTAVRHRKPKMAKILLEHGADATVLDGDGVSLLHDALELLSPEIAELLIAAGADIMLIHPDFPELPIVYAAALDDDELVKQILEKAEGLDGAAKTVWDAVFHQRSTTISWCQIINWCIEQRVNIERKCSCCDQTLLYSAVHNHNVGLTEQLLYLGADPCAADEGQRPSMKGMMRAEGNDHMLEILSQYY